jgi:hypothetical protein
MEAIERKQREMVQADIWVHAWYVAFFLSIEVLVLNATFICVDV